MLITGVNGYIGLKIALNVLQKSNVIIGLDSNSANCVSLAGSSNYKFIQADITKKETFPSEIRGTDVLIHCAALVHKRSSDLSRENYFRINCEGTENVLDFLDKGRLRQIIFISTVSVYGDLSYGVVPDENSRAAPEDFYGESKLAAENTIKEFSNKHKIPYTIFRLTPVYGDLFLLNINKRIYLPGGTAFYKVGAGEQRMSLASVNNVVDVVVDSINNSNYFNETFIVKDMEDYSINEIISSFKDIFSQHGKPVVQVPLCLPKAAFKLMGFVMPERARYYGYQLRKIADNAVYSGAKLHKMIQLKWNLKNTLKKY
ncbi:MAG TPA: NAD(P)-dependent oxidoreductase [Syntrophorhabdaceae bacterium]|nr:NAD(P)-dependent oxidoreductase [Syntrophorhabdaceae bacterium]